MSYQTQRDMAMADLSHLKSRILEILADLSVTRQRLNSCVRLILCNECEATIDDPTEIYGWMPGLCPACQAKTYLSERENDD